jgi:hypothetical protein
MIVTCTLCGQRFETEGRASECPHTLVPGAFCFARDMKIKGASATTTVMG